MVVVTRGFVQVQLRQLNGYDEQYIAEIQDGHYSIPFRTTTLLSRVIKKFGNNKLKLSESETRRIVQKFTIGDRVALMLHLRRLTFGDTLRCTVSCPSCKVPLSLDLSISSLLQPPILQPRSEYDINLENFTLKIVLCGAKVEAILEERAERPGRGEGEKQKQYEEEEESELAEKLVRSCIISSEPALPGKLNDHLLLAISGKLGELDPQADIVLDATCSACQRLFQTPFDVEDFIFQEIGMRHRDLDREVHWLAFHYHWSEDSILSLSLVRRKKYIELINRTLSGDSI